MATFRFAYRILDANYLFMSDQDKLIFLSYASQDRERVQEYYAHLVSEGFKVWMDVHDIRGGQNWDFEIKRALKRASIVIVFLSGSSVDKRGYCQREIKIALNRLEERLLGDTFIIPVSLEPQLTIPDELEHIHVIRSDEVDSFAELSRSISAQFVTLGAVHEQVAELTGVSYSIETVAEEWDGLPGYDFKYDVLRLSSERFPEVAKVTDILRGEAVASLLSERLLKFDQVPTAFNFGQDRFRRQNSMEVICRAPMVTGRAISIVQEINWYSAGAAHPTSGYHTINFLLDPLVKLDRVEDIFADDENAFSQVQKLIRQGLLDPADPAREALEEKWVKDGTTEWDAFQNFAFSSEGLLVLFGPYEVGPYAAGSHSAEVSYAQIAPLMKPEIAAALSVD